MPVLSQKQRASWVEVQGRKVKLFIVDPANGIQSVRVCSRANKPGHYREVFYFAKGFWLTSQEVGRYGSLALLIKDLRERSYKQAKKV